MSALNDKKYRHNSKKSLLHDQSVPILQEFLRHDSRIEYFAPMADLINQPECRLTQNKVEKNRQSRTLPISKDPSHNSHFQSDYNQISNEFRIDQLEAHYHFIEKALNEENLNLKCQKDYLSNEVRKLYKRQKLFKQQLRQAKQSITELTQENQLIKSALHQIRHFILNIVTHIESIMRQRSDQDVLVHSKLLFQQLKDFVTDQNNNSTNSKLITQKLEDQQGYFSRLEQNCKSKLSLSEELGLDSNDKEADSHINKQLQELNDRFEALMYEYKTSNNPQLRKKCIQIAKQMKNIKLASAKEVQTKQSIQNPKKNDYNANYEENRPSIEQQMTPASKGQLQKQRNLYISMKKNQKQDLVNKSTERISRKLLQKKPLNDSTDQIDTNFYERGQISMHKRDSTSSRKAYK